MVKSLVVRSVVALLAVTGCALVAGCLSGNPSYLPYLLPAGDPAVQTHARPPGPGYFADYDPNACRIVVRPELCTAPVRGTQVFIATVYDADGTPRRKRRVEWMLEGPGTIMEVDESGYLPGRGMKVDNRYAFSYTNYLEHCITRGRDEFTIRPGQTWCLVTSAVEGETTVTAYCPAINDWDKNRAYGKVNWVEGDLLFPPPVTARAGGDYTLNTTVTRAGDAAAGYRVRYRILDGPAAALTGSQGGDVASVTEAVTPIDRNGAGRVNITQPLPAAGTNRIGIEIVKPDPDKPGQFTVVSKGETRVTWKSAQVGVTVSAPKTFALNQDATVSYAITGSGKLDTGSVTLTAMLPEGIDLIRTEPKAAIDGDTLIWTLPAATGGKQQSVQAVVRPNRNGQYTFAADARTEDGVTGRGSVAVNVNEAKLLLKLDGPTTGVVGESLPFQVSLTNNGNGVASGIRVQTRLDEGLEIANKTGTFDETIATLAAGQSRTIALPMSARQGGKFAIQVAASAERGGMASPQLAIIDVKDARLALSVHGPARGYVGQEVTWQLAVQNNGEVPAGAVIVKATLPAEISFVSATDGGKASGRQVVWDLGTAPIQQKRTLTVTGLCNNVSNRTTLTATMTGTPVTDPEGRRRPVAMAKPLGTTKPVESHLEIIGMAALQMSVKDSSDPVSVGQRTTYSIRLKNAGTQAANAVVVTAEIPRANLRPTRATGPGAAGKIGDEKDKESYTVRFPALDSLAPNAETTFVIEVEALIPGDARVRVEARSASQAQPVRAEEPTRILGKESRPFDR